MTRALAIAWVLATAATAAAQPHAPPPVPDVPDEPLPAWHPPTTHASNALFLSVAPQVAEAQKLRQVGLIVSCVGWAQIFAAGIVYAAAADTNDTLSSLHPTGVTGVDGTPNLSTMFDPGLEDKRNREQAASIALFSIGGAMAAAGFVLYTIGQTRLHSWHDAHPREPLPPLSGF
jgi:hypothetical protein